MKYIALTLSIVSVLLLFVVLLFQIKTNTEVLNQISSLGDSIDDKIEINNQEIIYLFEDKFNITD